MTGDGLGLMSSDPDDPDDPDDLGAHGRHDERARGRSRPEASTAVARRSQARRRRRTGTVVALIVLASLVAVVYFGGQALLGGLAVGDDGPADFTGEGVADVVVQVRPGDSTGAIGTTLTEAGVVASTRLFTEAAAGMSAVASVQPGFYVLRTRLPAVDAASRLVAEDSRVGQLVIPEGLQLEDVIPSSGEVNPGILARISEASCVTLDGTERCTSLEELTEVAAGGDLSTLGVPDWAVEQVSAIPDTPKRLEGLIRPGSYNVAPAAPAADTLNRLITRSAESFAALGLPESAAGGLSPYQVLVAASLIEREALPNDFAKVAQVIYNRLAIDQRLEFDSTVNYPLEVQNIATTSENRDEVTPWNTYASTGLPATPISAPGDEAIMAAENPEPGTWLFFVTVDSAGTTIFSDTFAEHQEAIEIARANGVFS